MLCFNFWLLLLDANFLGLCQHYDFFQFGHVPFFSAKLGAIRSRQTAGIA
jgi:hypothetical protein